MGHAGKVAEREAARDLRAEAWTMANIAAELGVSMSSVSRWVRDVATVVPGRPARKQASNTLQRRRLDDVQRCEQVGRDEIGELSQRELLLVGVALYVGEGFKTQRQVGMANTDPQVLRLFVTWLRRCFGIDESRLRVRLYLHDGLELEAAEHFWSELLAIPRQQFRSPYRAVADASRRTSKHVHGCPSVIYSDAALHRRVMGLARAISCADAIPG